MNMITEELENTISFEKIGACQCIYQVPSVRNGVSIAFHKALLKNIFLLLLKKKNFFELLNDESHDMVLTH